MEDIQSKRMIPMPLRPQTPYAISFTGALIADAFLFSPAYAAQSGPFAGLAGAWSGTGVISSNDGRSERMRCQGRYSVADGGSRLSLRLNCASDSYHFDANSGVVVGSGGEITGAWSESGTNATGAVNARATQGRIAAKIAGPGFTADMRIETTGNHQRVQITPSGAQIKSVSVEMRRA
jgi:hypothetical protein